MSLSEDLQLQGSRIRRSGAGPTAWCARPNATVYCARPSYSTRYSRANGPFKAFTTSARYLAQSNTSTSSSTSAPTKKAPGTRSFSWNCWPPSLTALLEETPSSPPLPFHTAVNLCHDVSLALAYLHSNDIIHRDLSSNNVLLTKERKARVTYKLDSFSYGVLTVQMLTRKFPAPGPPRKRINDPRYGLHPIEVPIPEPERRKSHIDLIDPSHPLLKFCK
eukprot:Em0137g3a